jgi:hypothetical protein
MAKVQGFIQYQKRSNNNNASEYGTFCIAKRVNRKKINDKLWLGKVIDEENGIFFNKKNGYCKFTIS